MNGKMCAVAAILSALSGTMCASPPEDTVLWYDEPAGKDWHAALPLGNGRLGAMVFGNPDREQIQFNDDTLYALEPETCMFIPDIRKDLEKVVAWIRSGDYGQAHSHIKSNWLGRSNAPYQPFGDLLVEFAGSGAVTNYARRLDLRDGIIRIDYERANVKYHREVFVSHPDQVLAMRVSADTPGSIGFRALLDTPHTPAASWRADGPDTQVMSGQGPGEALRRDLVKQVEAWGDQRKYPAFYEPDGKGGWKRRFDAKKQVLYGKDAGGRGTFFEARLLVRAEGGTVKAAGDGVTVESADAATLLLAAATSFNGFDKSPSREGADPSAAAKAALAGAAARPFDALVERHANDHRPLFDRVGIRLGAPSPRAADPTDERVRLYAKGGDPSLAALYYQFSRYLMIAGSRPGTQPLNLQGIWNRDVIPPWNAGYTININTEMNYWNAGRGNLLECEEPLMRMLSEAVANGSRVAKEAFGCRGWCASHNMSIWRECAPVDGNTTASWWPLGAGWLCQHIWTHYEFTQDRAFLGRMYPVLRGASEFLLDWIIDRGDGKWVTPVSTSPENNFVFERNGGKTQAAVTMGATMDMAIIRELFANTARAADLLGADPAFRAELSATIPRLLGYQTGRHGQIQEWDRDFDESEVEHRHMSHLYGFFPGDEITPERTPHLMDALRTTLARRGDGATGWSLGWKLNLQARMRDGDKVRKLLNNLLNPSHTCPNLFDLCPPFQIDGNFGAARGIAECLLQDHRGFLHLLPALPAAWQEGAVRGLRARGGYEVDIAWKDGKLCSAAVRSVAGGPVRVRCEDRTADLPLQPGMSAKLGPDLRPK